MEGFFICVIIESVYYKAMKVILTRSEISQLKSMAKTVEFTNDIPNAKVGVFGHTHRAFYYSIKNGHVKVNLVK